MTDRTADSSIRFDWGRLLLSELLATAASSLLALLFAILLLPRFLAIADGQWAPILWLLGLPIVLFFLRARGVFAYEWFWLVLIVVFFTDAYFDRIFPLPVLLAMLVGAVFAAAVHVNFQRIYRTEAGRPVDYQGVPPATDTPSYLSVFRSTALQQRKARAAWVAILAVIAVLAAVAMPVLINRDFWRPSVYVAGAAVVVAMSWLLSLWARYMGRIDLRSVRPAGVILDEDSRDPVLILRPFLEDGKEDHDPDYLGSDSLAPLFWPLGPVVTLRNQQAKQLLPKGAVQIDVDGDWETFYRDYAERACRIVVAVGPGPGLAFEVGEIVRHRDWLAKTCFIAMGSTPAISESKWQAVRAALEPDDPVRHVLGTTRGALALWMLPTGSWYAVTATRLRAGSVERAISEDYIGFRRAYEPVTPSGVRAGLLGTMALLLVGLPYLGYTWAANRIESSVQLDRLTRALALTQINDLDSLTEAALDLTLEDLPDDTDSLIERLATADRYEQSLLLTKLSAVGLDAAAVARLARLAATESHAARLVALLLLASGPDDDVAIGVLVDALADSDFLIRSAAALSLGDRLAGSKADEVLTVMQQRVSRDSLDRLPTAPLNGRAALRELAFSGTLDTLLPRSGNMMSRSELQLRMLGEYGGPYVSPIELFSIDYAMHRIGGNSPFRGSGSSHSEEAYDDFREHLILFPNDIRMHDAELALRVEEARTGQRPRLVDADTVPWRWFLR